MESSVSLHAQTTGTGKERAWVIRDSLGLGARDSSKEVSIEFELTYNPGGFHRRLSEMKIFHSYHKVADSSQLPSRSRIFTRKETGPYWYFPFSFFHLLSLLFNL